ncbi:hypothetical protein OOJ96_13910 [Pseudomonas sp. 15FMM2]|uniref:Uncharacterized protein n=1 Tax=Pseudomonas imrae TaxID=2992837 RepID=A0ACC7PE11_9PSED
MPIDSNRYSNTDNYSSRYATKHQDIAPETRSSQGSSWSQPSSSSSSHGSSWSQPSSSSSSSAALYDKKPLSSMSSSQRQELEQMRKAKDTLEKLPNEFPIRSLNQHDYQRPISLLEQRINKLENGSNSKNPITRLNNYQERKKEEKELNKEMGALYKKARDVQLNGTNPTDKNRASNVTDTLTSMGRDQSWFQAVRKENRSNK